MTYKIKYTRTCIVAVDAGSLEDAQKQASEFSMSNGQHSTVPIIWDNPSVEYVREEFSWETRDRTETKR